MRKLIFLGFLLVFVGVAQGASDTSDKSDKSDFSKDKTADDLWAHLDKLKSQFMQARRQGDPVSKTLIPPIQAGLQLFVATYPEDKRWWEAKLALGDLDVVAGKLGLAGAPAVGKATQQLEAIVGDKSAPKDIRAQAEFEIIYSMFPEDLNTPVDYDALDAKLAAFQKDFPDFSLDGQQPAFVMLREQELQILKMTGNEARYLAVLNTLAKDPMPELAAWAKDKIAKVQLVADLKTKPMELSFTAVDGTKVDLAKLRGKVVLIDFWATWCAPCVAEVPNVVAAYQKFHDQEFEVVGISLDQDKDTMIGFTKRNGMAWPQYFDGGDFETNAMAKKFGIDSIPTMWLIDKKGLLVNTEASVDLDAKIEKLLKAP